MQQTEKQYNRIVNKLRKVGVFNIAKIEEGNNISRSQINKIIKGLVDKKILIPTKSRKTKQKGYKLNRSKKGLIFFLQHTEQATIIEIANAWDVSIASAKKYIKEFVDAGVVEKIGKPPKKISYTVKNQVNKYNYSPKQKEIIEKYYTLITAGGKLLKGVRGFEYKIKENFGEITQGEFERLTETYLKFRKKYGDETIKKQGFFEITGIFKNYFKKETYLEKLFYCDYDEVPIFGYSYLYQLIQVAKCGHINTEIMVDITERFQKALDLIIIDEKIDAVAFIPPTVMRKTQLLNFLKQRLVINKPIIETKKMENLFPIEQKHLKTIQEKEVNAKSSIEINSQEQYDNVLIIDDILNSGATLREVAKKIARNNIAKNIYGLVGAGTVNFQKNE